MTPEKIKEARALVDRLLVPSAYSAPYFDIPHPVPVQREAAASLTAALDEIERLREALRGAVATISDYIEYEHDGDPWTEDARAMGEMDIDDYATDGRLEAAREALKGPDQ